MFEIKGILEFNPANVSRKHAQQAAWKKVAMVRFGSEDETYRYYKWLLEQRFGLRVPDVDPFVWKGRLNDPVRGTHVTAINEIVDDEIYEQARKMFHGTEVRVTYDPTLIRCNRKNDKMWWHIKAYSDDIMNIRSAMGIKVFRFWANDIKKNMEVCVSQVVEHITQQKKAKVPKQKRQILI